VYPWLCLAGKGTAERFFSRDRGWENAVRTV
jgi:hypothetical protein